MCLDVRCPKTRSFHTIRMIFRKSAGPLILLTSTPCSFGLAGGLSFVGSKFEPTVFGHSYTQNLIQKYGRVFASSLSKASEHDLEKQVPTTPKFLSILWPFIVIIYSTGKCLSAGFLYPGFLWPKINPIFFCEKRCKLVYIYTSPISHQEGAEDWPFICNVCHGWVKWFDQVMQTACSVHRLLSRWELKISGRKLVKLLPPIMDWSAPSCALSFLGKPWKVSQTLMSF